ncbi:protein of unknown function [Terribacillus halophilus]|uniref:DUF4178 domain-containing protein n=1 Tax=Terribacillus halophilus TaxID=361279 RepID=A0A1G6HSG4_9BACI|nr:DUF4178 domain-containing protein [Terribacillus halophilus]SDB97247.1 protein of unknown function [Terribacillus halophilus]
MGILSRIFKKKAPERPAVKERHALSIQVGDIVEYDLVTYEVVGKITSRQGNYEWFDYQLVEGDTTLWLSAEMDDELELGIYKKIPLSVSKPYPKQLSHEGRTYYLDEQGEARVVGEGRSRNVNGSIVHFADYYDEDEEHFLGLEGWGSEIEVSYGYEIKPREIKIIAGSN